MNRSALTRLLFGLLTLTGCSGEDPGEFNYVVETRTFTLNTHEGWTLSEGTGYDTYVGEISGPLGTIYFDQGSLSFGGLETVRAGGSTVYPKSLLVGGVPAILHKTRMKDNNRERMLITLYIDAGDLTHRNRLYAFDPDFVSEVLIVEVMKTHRFK